MTRFLGVGALKWIAVLVAVGSVAAGLYLAGYSAGKNSAYVRGLRVENATLKKSIEKMNEVARKDAARAALDQQHIRDIEQMAEDLVNDAQTRDSAGNACLGADDTRRLQQLFERSDTRSGAAERNSGRPKDLLRPHHAVSE